MPSKQPINTSKQPINTSKQPINGLPNALALFYTYECATFAFFHRYIMASHGCMDSSTCPWQDRGWKGEKQPINNFIMPFNTYKQPTNNMSRPRMERVELLLSASHQHQAARPRVPRQQLPPSRCRGGGQRQHRIGNQRRQVYDDPSLRRVHVGGLLRHLYRVCHSYMRMA